VSKRIVIVGAGKKNTEQLARARHLGLKISEEANKLKAKKVYVLATNSLFNSDHTLLQLSYGLENGCYKYPNISSTKEKKEDLIEFTISSSSKTVTKSEKERAAIAKAIRTCRLLQDGPPNVV